VKFLPDQNVSPALVGLLADADHVAEHVRDLGMREAPDDVVLAAARDADAVLISSDTDFGELLARSNANGPSVILLRRQEGRRASKIASLIVANLQAVADDLASGAIVVLDDDRVRIRSLPLQPENSPTAGRPDAGSATRVR
jgi:predicted nuclease of predicted toxin-antitoxin system